jgi:hypothetical protein
MMKAAAIAFIAGTLVGCPSAWADQQDETACVPQVGYFSVQKRMVDNIDIREINRLSRTPGAILSWPEALMRPSICAMRGHTIQLTAIPGDSANAKRDCGAHPGWNIQVAWDGKTIACLDGDDAYPERRQSVTITLNGVPTGDENVLLERCVVTLRPADRDSHPPKNADQGTLRCETTFFDPATGQPRTQSAPRGGRT